MKILKKLAQVIPVLLFVLGYKMFDFANWCVDHASSCSYSGFAENHFDVLWFPLYYFSLYAIVGGVILTFVPWRIFKSWLWFGIPWVIFSILFIYSQDTMSHTFFQLYGFFKNDGAKWTGAIFSIVTAFIVLIHLLRKPKVQKVTSV